VSLPLCVWQDIIYFPKKWDPILYVDTLPNVYAAHVRPSSFACLI
jgi:hypothetical protein